MMLRENLERVLKDYLKAKEEPLKDHPIGFFLRHSLPEDLKSLMGNPKKYKFDDSTGPRLPRQSSQSGNIPLNSL